MKELRSWCKHSELHQGSRNELDLTEYVSGMSSMLRYVYIISLEDTFLLVVEVG